MLNIKISGLYEAKGWYNVWATKTLSVVNPFGWGPDGFKVFGPNQWVVQFDDTTNGDFAPTTEDIEKILEFGRVVTPSDQILVHCHGGVSRSTATAIVLQVQQGATPEEAIRATGQVRPQMWPNELITDLADPLLNMEGRLAKAVRDWQSANLVPYDWDDYD